MEASEIIKGNKLIAEFIGAEFINDDPIAYPNGYYYLTGEEFDLPYDAKDFNFHGSWDWLMPVIEKISISKYDDGEKIYPRTFGMQNEDTGQFMFRFNRQQLFESDTLIDAAYNAVVSYIAECKLVKN